LYKRYPGAPQVHLPAVSAVGKLPVEEAILSRRSVWEYQDLPMEIEELSR
jgi:SagB-type dehydrogenase family enzyme